MNNRGRARGSPRGAGFSANRGQARGTPRGGRYSPRTGGHPSHRHGPQAGAGTGGPFPIDCPGSKEFCSNSEMESPQQMLPSSFSYHSEHEFAFSNAHRQEWHPSGRKDTLPRVESLKEGHKSTESASVKPEDLKCSVVLDSSHEGERMHISLGISLNQSRNLHLGVERMHIRETPSHMTGDGETSLPSKSEASSGAFPNSYVNTTGHRNPELSEHSAFHLCPTKAGSCVTPKASLLVQNREMRNEIKRSKEQQNGRVLQPGMVLLKGYLPHSDQAGAGTGGPFPNDCPGSKEFCSNSEMESPQRMLPSSFSNHSEHKSAFSNAHRQEWRPSGTKRTLPRVESLREGHKSTESARVKPEDLKCSVVPDSSHEGDFPSLSTLNQFRNLHLGVERMHIRETPSHMTGDGETSLPSKSEASSGAFPTNSSVNTTGHRNPELSEHSAFDLCPTKAGSCVTLKPSLPVKNREMRNEIKRSKEQQNGRVLQPGMVLLKGYLSLSDQINIVKLCRDLGLGPAGFYQPGYRDGVKLNLKMMCLGKNWDLETGNYGDHRPIDGAKPPSIPVEFFQLIEKVIKESHSLIRKDSKVSNSEDILPKMTPDICLVKFYSSSGRLGLHQDRDESQQSLCKGLPVVSFSIGDTAEFLYGDQRDVDMANKVSLVSGDVLIFGGKSRHVFHGVASIQPNTAPNTLLEKTNLRTGRLNLTFRQY